MSISLEAVFVEQPLASTGSANNFQKYINTTQYPLIVQVIGILQINKQKTVFVCLCSNFFFAKKNTNNYL